MTALKAAFMQANGAEQLHCINTGACKWDSGIFVTGNVLKEKSAPSWAFRAAFPAPGAASCADLPRSRSTGLSMFHRQRKMRSESVPHQKTQPKEENNSNHCNSQQDEPCRQLKPHKLHPAPQLRAGMKDLIIQLRV